MRLNLKERAKAFSVHLSASVVVGLSVFGLIWLVWYPPPLLQTQGVLNIFVILLLVDVVAGPILTFLVFNREKKIFEIRSGGDCYFAVKRSGLWVGYSVSGATGISGV